MPNRSRDLFRLVVNNLLTWRHSAKGVDLVDLRKFNGPFAFDALEESFDDALILQTFFARSVGLVIVRYAIGHVIELVCELVRVHNWWEGRLVRSLKHLQPAI